MFGLDGKTALITGASSGLGEHAARILSKAGCRVVLAARRLDRLKRICAEISAEGGDAFAVELDIADEGSIRRAAQKAIKHAGKIDILINNAGFGRSTPIMDSDAAAWDEQLNVNLRGTWLVTQALVKHMAAQKIRGSIINIASINGQSVPYTGAAAYGVSKAGVIHLTKQLVGEISGFGIRINAIAPGLFETPATSKSIKKNRKSLEREIPLGFIGEPGDISGLVLFLSSNRASRYVTGSSFTVDGGVSAHCAKI